MRVIFIVLIVSIGIIAGVVVGVIGVEWGEEICDMVREGVVDVVEEAM